MRFLLLSVASLLGCAAAPVKDLTSSLKLRVGVGLVPCVLDGARCGRRQPRGVTVGPADATTRNLGVPLLFPAL